MNFKCTIIGAGSMTFTRQLLRDMLSVPELQDINITFMDINQKYLDMSAKLCQQDIDKNGLNVKIETTTDRRAAISGAKYIFNLTRIGGLEAFMTDVEIPLAYGINQCVGDTLCAGGIMYGQRGINAILEFCKDIREVAAPNAKLFNYGNPNAMLTWAANKYGKVETIGLCHGVKHTLQLLADALEIDVKEIDAICAGINHQTWFTRLTHKGEDLNPRLLEAFEKHPELACNEKVRIDIFKHFGYFSTESNGHLSEYLPWYRKTPQDVERWIGHESWIHGETKGYLRICTENRTEFEDNFDKWMAEPYQEFIYSKRSVEHASYMIESFETGRIYRGYFNVINNGAISNLPDDCIVEVPGYIDGNGINITQVGDLPMGCAAVCSQSIWVQKLAVEAAVHADIKLLRQAMLLDPLVGAICSPEEVYKMVDELLIAQEEWLPQYKEEIAKAKLRQNI